MVLYLNFRTTSEMSYSFSTSKDRMFHLRLNINVALTFVMLRSKLVDWGDCFVSKTPQNRINYYVGGEITISHID